MDAFYERLIVRAATIDELLSDDFESPRGEKGDTRARLLVASPASAPIIRQRGDQSLYFQRLQRDGWATDDILDEVRDHSPQDVGRTTGLGCRTRSGLKPPPCKPREANSTSKRPDRGPAEGPIRSSICSRRWFGGRRNGSGRRVDRRAVGNLTETARVHLLICYAGNYATSAHPRSMNNSR